MQVNDFIRLLFERAADAGFDAAEVDYVTGEDFTVGVKNGEIIDYSVSSSQGLGFRALIGGKMGYASTQVLDGDAVDLLINGARENAALIENADEQFIFEGSADYPELNVYNDSIDALTAEQKIALARDLEKACLSIDPRVTQCEEVEVMTMGGSRRIVNTRGLDVSHRDNALGIYAGVIAQDQGDVTTGGAMALVRDVKDLDIAREAARAVKDAVDMLHAEKAESGSRPIVLRYDVAGAILSTFKSVFSADNAQKGLSLLKGREGEIIAAPCVSIVDDPLDPRSPAATPFDGEGVAARKLDLITAGRLNTLMHNLKTAKKQGVETTASASKPGYNASVGVGPHGLFIVPGECTCEQLIARVDDGLYITDVQGLHSGANQISGDFSLGARGFLIKDGHLAGPVSQITVAGNFFELLKNIAAVGSDLKFEFSAVASPDLLVNGLTVAGK